MNIGEFLDKVYEEAFKMKQQGKFQLIFDIEAYRIECIDRMYGGEIEEIRIDHENKTITLV